MFKKEKRGGGGNEAACPGDDYLLSSGMRICFCMNGETFPAFDLKITAPNTFVSGNRDSVTSLGLSFLPTTKGPLIEETVQD